MPRPKKALTDPKTVAVTEPTLKALIRCRNELYNVYNQFGGTSNIHLSKGLGDKEADWKFVNSWELDNMDDEDSSPVKKASLPEKLNIPYIASSIYNSSNDYCQTLKILTEQEIKNRINSLFDEDLSSITTLADKGDFDDVSQLASAIGRVLKINLGTQHSKSWLSTATFGQFMAICQEIKEIIEEDDG